MSLVNILIGAIVGFIVYYICTILTLPNILCALIGVVVFLVIAFGGRNFTLR